MRCYEVTTYFEIEGESVSVVVTTCKYDIDHVHESVTSFNKRRPSLQENVCRYLCGTDPTCDNSDNHVINIMSPSMGSMRESKATYIPHTHDPG